MEKDFDEEIDELKKLAERSDREGEERRNHHHGERSRIHSFYPTEEEMEPERDHRYSPYQKEMEPKEHHRHS